MSAELDNLIATNLPDNVTRQIKPNKLREVFEQVSGELDAKVEGFSDLAGALGNSQLSGTYSNASLVTDGNNAIYGVPTAGALDTDTVHVISPASFTSTIANTVGAIVLNFPDNGIMSGFFMLEVDIYTYTTNHARGKHLIYGHFNTTANFGVVQKTTLGISVPIQCAVNNNRNGRVCIVLGNVGTSWNRPKINISSAIIRATDPASFTTGWYSEIVTSLDGFSSLTGDLPELMPLPIQNALDGKANTSHTHTLADISDAGSLAGKSTINNADWSGTALGVANGGTAATTIAGIRTNIGVKSMALRDVTISTSAPSGGVNGDVWLQVD